MRSLFIDTSSFVMTLAILEDGKVLASFKEEVLTDMAAKIIPTVKLLFEKVTFSIEDIDKIFVVNGPGSFTGVRVGVTAAKTMAWALKKEIIPLSSLEFLATTKVEKKNRVVAIDARRGYVYGGVYDEDLNPIRKDQYLPLTELTKYLEDGVLISRDSLEGAIKPVEDIAKIVEKHKEDISVNPHEVNPNYLKLTEAEEKKASKE